MQNESDALLAKYGNLAKATADYINSHFSSDEVLGVTSIFDSIVDLGKLYGADLDSVATAVTEANDIASLADKLRGDPMVLARLIGTLCQNLADVSACVYDVDTGLQVIECLGTMMGTVLIIQEFQDA